MRIAQTSQTGDQGGGPQRYDVIIVGSGAAGGFAAKELGENGLRVLVLEAGRDLVPEDAPSAAKQVAHYGPHLTDRIVASVTGRPLQARVAFYRARLKRFLVNDFVHRYVTPADAPYLWIRGRQLGGRIHAYGRVLNRWSNYEFKYSAGSQHAPWPIAYDDLAPFYDRAETLLAVHGNRDGVATAPDGVMAGPGLLTAMEQSFKAQVEATWSDRRVVAWRLAPPEAQALPIALVEALKSNCVTLRANSVVTNILTDPLSGLVTGVRFVDRKSRQPQEVQASAVMVCASPIESVRLLLNSRSRRHPGGIGNSSGLLGCCFMDQLAAIIFARYPGNGTRWRQDEVPTHPRYGTSGGVYIMRPVHADPVPHLAEPGCSYQGSIGRSPHVRPSMMRDANFMCFGEMLPHPDNKITLHPHRRDRWGMPLPIVTCAVHDEEKRAIQRHLADIAAMIEATGGKIIGWASPLGMQEFGEGLYRDLNPLARWIIRRMMPRSFVMGSAIHESGGARMGDDPRKSVLNPFNQCWDAPNLFVTDASAFPTSGVMGTTLTVMAMTLRACGKLVESLRKDEAYLKQTMADVAQDSNKSI